MKRGGILGTEGVKIAAPSRYNEARRANGIGWVSIKTVARISSPGRSGSIPRLMRCMTHMSWPGGNSL